MIKFIRAGMLICFMALSACAAGITQASSEKMTASNLKTLIEKFDEKAIATENSVTFSLNERELLMVYDEKADRMRIITPVAPSGIATEDCLLYTSPSPRDATLSRMPSSA